MDDEYGGLPGKGRETETRRFRAVIRAVPVACLLLFLFAGAVLLLDPQVAAAAQQKSPDLMEGGGRQISATDWLYHLPLALGVALLVVIVDAIVILRIVLGRRRNR